ncbi:Heme A synthase [Bacillus subtilis]|nr:Heme A synthase [Bacillus subtilis]
MNKALKALGVLTTFVMLIVLIGVPSLQKQVPAKDAADSGRCVTAVFSLN